MKKTMIMMALACWSVSVGAQTTEATVNTSDKYSVVTNSFWSNWFISAGATYNMFYTGEEKGLSDKPGLFDGARSTMGLSLAVGKWFTPGFGLRTKVTGFWGRYVTPDATGSLKNKSHNAYKYWSLQEQMLFNVSNLLMGYNENRVWNFIPYVGFGVTRNMTANDNAHGWSAGLLNTFRVSPRLAINFDLGFNLSDDRLFDAAGTTHKDYGTSFAESDRNFSVEVGLTYNLGKSGWKKASNVETANTTSLAEMDALKERLRASEANETQVVAEKDARIAQLESELAQYKAAASAASQSTTDAEEKPATLQPTVFFRKGMSIIDASQYAAISKVAKYMKNHPDAKILIKGYASSEGSLELNQKLSKARAEAVCKALVNRYKIEADRLTTEGFGPISDQYEEPEFYRIVTFSDTTK